MGNGTKVALVALLILMVVVIARFVRNESGDADPAADAKNANPPAKAAGAVAAQPRPAAQPSSATQTGAKRAIQPPTPAGSPAAEAGPRVVVVPRETTPAPGALNNNPAPAPAPAPAVAPAPAAGSSPTSVGTLSPLGTGATPAPTPPGPTASGSTVPPVDSRGVPPGTVERPGAGTSTALRPPRPIINGGDAPSRAVVPAPALVPQPAPGTGSDRGAPPVTTRLGQDTSAAAPAGNDPAAGPRLPDATRGTAATFPQTYKLEKGEGYWVAAQKVYNNGNLWPAIAKANPGVKLLPGNTLTIPEPPVVAKAPAVAITPVPQPAPGPARAESKKVAVDESNLSPIERIALKTQASSARSGEPLRSAAPTGRGAASGATEYIVKKGDTLSGLAQRFYKDAGKLNLITDANESLRGSTFLREGERLKIPAATR